MSSKNLDIVSGPVSLSVKGLAELHYAMQKAGKDAEDMKALLHRIGTMVARAATPPVVTGRLSGTIRAGKAKNRAIVRAGGARAEYAPIVHFGWPARGIQPQEFLYEALNSRRREIVSEVESGISDILRKNDLR